MRDGASSQFDSMNCGVNPDVLSEGCTVMESLQAVFDHDFFRHVKEETNKYVL